MTIALLSALIDKLDTAEVVRDQIGAILVEEAASQVALATAASKPTPNDWNFRVYLERSNPVELFVGQPEEGFVDQTPVVAVSYDGGTPDRSRSDMIKNQLVSGIFNIDTIAIGVSRADGSGGHISGDEDAVRNAERVSRLVRNIVMSALNHKLQQPTFIWNRWVDNIVAYRPEGAEDASFQVAAVRIALNVDYTEYSPQIEGQPLEYVAVDVKRASDDKLIAEADYDYTVP
jgi:hypothetical protein